MGSKVKTWRKSPKPFEPTDYKGEPLDYWLKQFSTPWGDEDGRVFELYCMKELGVTQDEWDGLDYWHRVEWTAYFVNQNKKMAIMDVDQKLQAKKNTPKK